MDGHHHHCPVRSIRIGTIIVHRPRLFRHHIWIVIAVVNGNMIVPLCRIRSIRMPDIPTIGARDEVRRNVHLVSITLHWDIRAAEAAAEQAAVSLNTIPMIIRCSAILAVRTMIAIEIIMAICGRDDQALMVSDQHRYCERVTTHLILIIYFMHA